MSQKTTPILKSERLRYILIFTIPIFLILYIIIFSIISGGGQQFSDLAQAFVHGQLNFLHPIGGMGQDPVLYHGRIYWDDGPFPGVILMPFVALLDLFHHHFYQGYLQWIMVVGILFFVFRLARVLSYSIEDSLVLSSGFVLGSVFIGVATISSSWFFAQVLTTFLIFWGLYEFYTHKRWWLLGCICGMIFLTRSTAAPIIIFFALELIGSNKQKISKVKMFLSLLLPGIVAVIIQGVYNFIRFHNPFNGGFEYQLISRDSAEARSMGIFNIKHIPTNLVSLLFRGPAPLARDSTSWSLKFPFIDSNPFGMSIFFTSPYLLSLFMNKWSSFDKQARHLLISVAVSGLLVLSYYGLGMDQFGYRYALDFMPALFLLFMIMYKRSHDHITLGMRSLIIASGVLNFYLLCTFIQ